MNGTFGRIQLGNSQESDDPQGCMPLELLIVEDMPEDAKLIVLALETGGIRFNYQIVSNIQQCAIALQERHWQAVLSDFRLLEATAYDVLEHLQAVGLDIPLILVTGALGEESAVDCIKAGVADYVLKDRLFRLPAVLQRSLREFDLRRQQQAALQQIQQQATRASLINRIVQSMRGTLVFEEVLQTIVDRLHDALEVSRCTVFLRHTPTARMISCYISQLTAERDLFLGIECPLFEHFSQELAQGQVVQLNQMTCHGAEVQQFATQFGIRAMLVTPLVYQQNYYGGICIHQCDRERVWTPDEVAMVKAIADQGAIAIYQSQLFQHLQQQAQREQVLNRIGRTLNSSLDPDYILQGIVKLTGECFNVDRVFIFAVAADQVRITHEWRAHDQIVPMLNKQVLISNWLGIVDSETGEYFTQPIHVPNNQAVHLNSAQLECVQETHRQSLLSVPVFIRDQFFGGIELHTTSCSRVFSEEEITLLQRIADQTAIALYNAQSYERLEELVIARTRELEAEKLLSEAANRAKSEFLANMSHELRTPLTSILGFSSVLLKQVFGSLNEKQVQYLENVYSSGEHLLELINDLLDLSKIEAGREDLFLEDIIVAEVCEGCIQAMLQQAVSKGLTLTCNVSPDIICRCDRRRLKQIILNLLSNAVKFTERGLVSLNVFPEGDRLKFAVIDTGIGIDSANLSQLFQPFHQAQSGLDRKYQGTGLGLALARKLAQLHGGTITVQSTVGQGSCFTLELPWSAPAFQ